MNDVFVKLEDVSLVGIDTNSRSTSLKTLILSHKQHNDWDIPILNNINLEINSGERVGIVGPNGAGKSSLLRVVAGIYPPTSGKRTVHGNLAPVLSAALGYNPEVSGRDNIKLALMHNCQLSKFNKHMEAEIIEFSGLGEKIDRPLRNYSNGMLARLAFAVTFYQQADITLLDEVFAMGDEEFRTKSRDKIMERIDGSSIVVIVSHDYGLIKDTCSRCLLMERGGIVADGDTYDVFKMMASAEH